MSAETTISKKDFIKNATAYGVTTNYSGGTQTMFVGGDDAKVKSFIRLCNLKGKKAYKYGIAQK